VAIADPDYLESGLGLGRGSACGGTTAKMVVNVVKFKPIIDHWNEAPALGRQSVRCEPYALEFPTHSGSLSI
jgi:hypothetical protein